MKISITFLLSLLFLASFIQFGWTDEESCILGNTTYVLCVVDETGTRVVSGEFSGDVLLEECHEHFSEDLLGKPICHEHAEEEKEEKKSPTTAQRYGYGFLAVFIICVLSFAGLLAFPCLYKISFQYILATFTALAVGTLFGDAMFHLIPFALGLHSHESGEDGHADEHEHRRKRTDDHEGEDHSSITVPIYQWRMFVAVMILYAFYLLEIFLHWLTHYIQDRSAIHSTDQSPSVPDEAQDHHSHNHNYNELDPTLVCVGKNCPNHGSMSRSSSRNGKTNANGNEIEQTNSPKVSRATGWMIILGDGIHNFADGLAIGAAFSANLMLGLTTTIAVGCHELPHEFGDYAILIQSGFTHRWALFWNFISATTAIIGFFVGAAVSTNESARQWIFAVTIGMFLYIALVDLLPTLLQHGRFQLIRFICVNIGFLVGIAIMFILAIFEDKLLHAGQ